MHGRRMQGMTSPDIPSIYPPQNRPSAYLNHALGLRWNASDDSGMPSYGSTLSSDQYRPPPGPHFHKITYAKDELFGPTSRPPPPKDPQRAADVAGQSNYQPPTVDSDSEDEADPEDHDPQVGMPYPVDRWPSEEDDDGDDDDDDDNDDDESMDPDEYGHDPMEDLNH
ncbi:hypothetical protein P280DRAFT_472714 [Massarina eburnea CBS 473.64]|uniref:Uncharacterized protein n=1 Tax=Massarina eburnea CBS 473.64 TaxID=1395130 RepID=A0A6A6RNR0_9PLEO|nr:hypothetical protein P280DRAFT_472714 [Massarina eburnea CBS 473.64]